MKRKKWILPVCIMCSFVVLCLAAVFVIAYVMSVQGYGISTGRLYFDDNYTFLIDENDMAMIVSDCSKDKKMYEGYQSGDKVLIIHDGVETSYPSRTGGYHIFRLSKGDGSYKPTDEVLGISTYVQIGWTDRDAYLENNVEVFDFDAQYIRTDGYMEDAKYPGIHIIRSLEELHAYYEQNRDVFDLERRDKVYSDSSIGFLDACDKYDEAYFEKSILIVILLEEGSGSIRHKVEKAGVVDEELVICIDSIVPEVGTCDMAQWHIMVEPKAGINVENEADITVLLDGVNPLTQPETVQHSRGYANISLTIPDGWEYYAEDSGDENDFCIAFWPEGQTEGKIKVWYYDSFGVCGTGLKEEKITIGEYEAYQGTYDNRKTWNFISFLGMPGSYVVLNEGTDTWWSEYGEEAMQILATVKIADGVIEEAEAIEIAKKNVTVEYDQTRAKFDAENGLWTVSFSKKNTAGGDQVITITHEGKIIDEEYGE